MSKMEGEICVVDVNDILKNMKEECKVQEKLRGRSICKLPAHVTDIDSKAYEPQAVSLGPYHHRASHLQPMEQHKHRALCHFMKRLCAENPSEPYSKALEDIGKMVQDLKDAYDQLDLECSGRAFSEMMILDGCFILEILADNSSEYLENDPIFSKQGRLSMSPILEHDMLLLENQVPLRVLVTLIRLQYPSIEPHHYVTRLILRFLTLPLYGRGERWKDSLHILDVYRKSLLLETHITPEPQETARYSCSFLSSCRKKQKEASPHADTEIREMAGDTVSAAKLYDEGVILERSIRREITNVEYKNSTLKLPVIMVTKSTKSRFLNLMAFEQFHIKESTYFSKWEVTSYIFFFGNLIKRPEDVAKLTSAGILHNYLGTNEDVTDLFRLLARQVAMTPQDVADHLKKVYRKVRPDLGNYYAIKRRHWLAHMSATWRKKIRKHGSDLKNNYFSSPWKIIALVAGVIIFILDIIQTHYAVIDYKSNLKH